MYTVSYSQGSSDKGFYRLKKKTYDNFLYDFDGIQVSVFSTHKTVHSNNMRNRGIIYFSRKVSFVVNEQK